MQKEKFITVMAVFDENTQEILSNIENEFEQQYGPDTKTSGIPFHITLGSYSVDETDEIVSRIIDVAKNIKPINVHFTGFGHFGNMVRFIKPEINEELLNLHTHFDSDYANGFKGWKPHITLYRHSEPMEIEISKSITDKLEALTNAKIVGIELGEFFPPKKIIHVTFNQ